jgi:site-specific DNA-methyltransferase (adenine-specific)
MNKATWDHFNSETEFFQWTFSWLDLLIPKLKQTGSIYIFNTPYNSAFILQHLTTKNNLIFQNWITWDKRDSLGSSKKKYSHGQETILFFTKSKKYTFNYNNIRIPYESTERIEHAAKKGILKNRKRWFPNPKGKYCGEVWHFPSERHVTKLNGKIQKLPHITPKPLAMIERIVNASSNKGDLILDCFIGSGTTAVAAKKLERNYIGSDSNLSYVELTQQKINKLQNNYIKFDF